ncbi:VWA domain-containing protein [soil metagenome]
MIDFERPGFLLLIPVAIFLLWLGQRRSLTRWTRGQWIASVGLRCAILTLVCVAVAGPRWLTQTTETAVVYLWDVSGSISKEASEAAKRFIATSREGKEKRSAEVEFAGQAEISRAFGEKAEKEPVFATNDATDLGAALEFATAILPADKPGRIVLLSDGVATTGRKPAEVAATLRGKVEIDTVPLPAASQVDAAVMSLKAPGMVREGETFNLMAKVRATAAVSGATVKLYQNNLLLSEVKKDLPEGVSEVVFPNIRAEGRTGIYDVEVAAPGDAVLQNNKRRLALAHGGAARVLIVDEATDQAGALAEALRNGGFECEVRPPQGFPSGIEELEGFDLVFFCDAPAPDFTDGQLKLLADWVRNFGGGFVEVGGEDSFGAGGYFKTPIAALLPVRIEREEREETPVVALLVVLDRSGSMSAYAGDGSQTKIDLADEGATLAMQVLDSKDIFGVDAVDTRVQQVVPLAKIGDRQQAARTIAGITAGGGGIYIYTSLAETLPRMREAKAKIKHVILFSDAADAEEKTAGENNGATGGGTALDLASAMLANRITLSVVALGTEQDKDTAFLRQLAAQGGGRFYLTADATSLPRLFTLETMRATETSLREDVFQAVPKADHEVLKGITWKEAPLLMGLNITQLKPGAELLLSSEKGDPLLAVWRYGAGSVAAFTSDAKGRWASEWLGWPGYGKFWTQLARELVKSGVRKDLTFTVKEEEKNLVIEADAISEKGDFRDDLDVSVSLAAQGSAPVSVKAVQTGPGTYRATVPKPDAESAMVAISDGKGRPLTAGWTRGYSAEYLLRDEKFETMHKLAEMTGGKMRPEPGEVFRPTKQAAQTRRDLAPYLLGLALMLWPVDIWVRRREWGAA